MRMLIPLLVICSINVACGTALAKKSSKKNTSCVSKLDGNWQFGRAPYGCAINSNDAAPLEAKYNEYIFDDTKTRTEETTRFTTNMHDFLTEYSTAYMKRRLPSATDSDIAQWNLLVLSTAHQESFWTHYRRGNDQMFRFFKGDSGHGYGLMQIDNRWHKSFINSKKAYDLSENFVYALDILFQARAKAIKSPCSGKKDALSINRSAYSAYNGGPAARCRWTDANHKWSRNDKNFYQKITEKAWEPVVAKKSTSDAVAMND